MHELLPAAIFLLMVSVGMSLRLGEVFAHLGRLEWNGWLGLLTATFLIPPALALLLAEAFHLTPGEAAGLFMVGVAPGAPLLTRNMARKGFDMHIAASYQVWAAMMVPVMIPLVVAAAGKIYGRDIWIPPIVLLKQIALKELLPLGVGMVIVWMAPAASRRFSPLLNGVGNALLVVMIGLILFKMGAALREVTLWVPVAAVLLAVGSIGAILLVQIRTGHVGPTFAICNANRHVGLALLLTGQYIHARDGLPTVAYYAILAPVVMIGYVRLFPPKTDNPVAEAS